MNWLPLRKNNIPIIDRQVNKALKIYNEIQQSIMEGDILAIQKMSEFQLSIRKRVQQMDDFYNKNCLDQRVRFLQGARMKLSKILHQNIINQKESNVNLPWKNTSDIKNSRNSNSSSKKVTPKKNTPKNESQNNQKQLNINNRQQSRSPIKKTPIKQQQQQNKIRKKVNLSVQIPNLSPKQQNTQQNNNNNKNDVTTNQKISRPNKSTRKMQHIPRNQNRLKSELSQATGNNNKRQQQINKFNKSSTKVEQSFNQPKIKISQPPGMMPTSSRSKITNISGKSRTITEGSNTNSMRKLNDLIFTIKMTKQEYQDFVQVKKKLNQR